MAASLSILPVREDRESLAAERRADEGVLFREVLAPRAAPIAPPSTIVDALPFIGMAILVALEMLRLA